MPAMIALLAAATMLMANGAAFVARAEVLERTWQAEQAAGVPAGQLAEARRELAAEREQRVGPLPAALLSGAATRDPFGRPEASAAAAYRDAMTAARARAQVALDRRRTAAGPNGDLDYRDRLVLLWRAGRPIDLDRLAHGWTGEAIALEATRQLLASVAGGMRDGLPADVVAASAGLVALADRAAQGGVGTTDAGVAVAHAQQYLARPYADQLAGHQALIAELRAARDRLERRLDLRSHADQLMGRIPDMLDQAVQYGAGDDFKGRVDAVRSALASARTAGDDARLDAALNDLQALDDDLERAAGGRLPIAGLPCLPGSPNQLIVIHLATQQLVAYDKGCPMLRTPVTTGRPALPTGRGTFTIFYKAPRYHMVSPWPQGSPFYYSPAWVSNAMEFISNGTFMHSADWQPDWSYGPDSQYGPYASHGCIHVIDGPLQQLYDWAAIGATVVVGD